MRPHSHRIEVGLLPRSLLRLLCQDGEKAHRCRVELRRLELAAFRTPPVTAARGRNPEDVAALAEQALHLAHSLAISCRLHHPLLIFEAVEVLFGKDCQQVPALAKGHGQRIGGDLVPRDEDATLGNGLMALELHEDGQDLRIRLRLVIGKKYNIIALRQMPTDLGDLIFALHSRGTEFHHCPEEIIAPFVEVDVRSTDRLVVG
mmetsp:Transcript_46749/g.99886  ORF Transcript_46749/g.99886 Transcript_46749/m.99886 type:complete len:204 (+) Transcript_46749:365-976(+)